MILWYFIIKPRVTVSVPHNKLRSFSKVISCLKPAVPWCYLSLPHSFTYNLPPLIAVFIQYFPSSPPFIPSLVLPTLTLTPHLLYVSPVCQLPLLLPVFPRSPLPSILAPHVSSKLPTKESDRSTDSRLSLCADMNWTAH